MSAPRPACRRSARRAPRDLPIYGETLHQYMLYTQEDYKPPERPDVPHLPVAEVAGRPGGAVARHAGRHRSTASPPTSSAARCKVKTQGKPHRRHHRRQLRRRAARGADVHRDGRQPRLLAAALRRPGLDQRRARHGPLSAQGRHRGRERRRHLHARPGARAHGARRRSARGRLQPVGGPRVQPGRHDHPARQGRGRERRLFGDWPTGAGSSGGSTARSSPGRGCNRSSPHLSCERIFLTFWSP